MTTNPDSVANTNKCETIEFADKDTQQQPSSVATLTFTPMPNNLMGIGDPSLPFHQRSSKTAEQSAKEKKRSRRSGTMRRYANKRMEKEREETGITREQQFFRDHVPKSNYAMKRKAYKEKQSLSDIGPSKEQPETAETQVDGNFVGEVSGTEPVPDL
ncbi:hypothetical protein MBLNU457_g0432t2 [Dothideomycetes sp. NU457]